ncbi:MAG TPA: fumarylacetoacetase [Acidobacteriaceae bacterium]|jgi:fumarylacetoacetase|nr:fumarylacetoacetase [Acidobacteriaceae bacterium]
MKRKCWVESANDPGTDFPVENLPLGRFDDGAGWRYGLAIGDQILDLAGCGLGFDIGRFADVRARAAELLCDAARRTEVEPLLVPQSGVRMLLPFAIGDYTDFYASIHHATNVGRLFRPDNPLLPNYKWVPIGYHGRASSVVVSGTEIRRPSGQTKAPDAAAPAFGPSRMLDYELEVGFFVGTGNALGTTIPLEAAESHITGLCLMNDWSARDIQAWEYQPLGPFLGKSFGTTISPWVVSLEALGPYRVPAAVRPEGDPEPLPYLRSERDRLRGGFDIHLEVWLATARMRAAGDGPVRVSQGNLRDLYWTLGQMVTHHASNGCNLRAGDLVATGTVSGAAAESVGSLLERTKRGAEPLVLPNGEARRFLEDGDEVILRGWCEREGFPRIGFGECRGVVGAALSA